MKPKFLMLLFALAQLLASCEKSKNDLPVEFKFVLLDTLENEKTVFNQGENIIFSFRVINKSTEDLMLETFFPNNDFFRVYQPNTNEGTLNYGTPYEHLFCEFIGGIWIQQNDTFKIEIPWYESIKYTNGYIGCPLETYHNEVSFLMPGEYFTEFSQSFKMNDIQTEEKHFKINFTIE